MITLGLPYPSVVNDMKTIDEWFIAANIRPGVVMKIMNDSTQVRIDNVYIVYGFDDETLAMQFRLSFNAKLVELDGEELEYMERALNNEHA